MRRRRRRGTPPDQVRINASRELVARVEGAARAAGMSPAAFADLVLGKLLDIAHDELRPRTRAECEGGVRPCPWVSCKHHLAIDVLASGSIVLQGERGHRGAIRNRRNRTHSSFAARVDDFVTLWWDPVRAKHHHTCSLDIAAAAALALDTVGSLMWVTKERVRQIEIQARGRVALRLAELGITAEEFWSMLDGG